MVRIENFIFRVKDVDERLTVSVNLDENKYMTAKDLLDEAMEAIVRDIALRIREKDTDIAYQDIQQYSMDKDLYEAKKKQKEEALSILKEVEEEAMRVSRNIPFTVRMIQNNKAIPGETLVNTLKTGDENQIEIVLKKNEQLLTNLRQEISKTRKKTEPTVSRQFTDNVTGEQITYQISHWSQEYLDYMLREKNRLITYHTIPEIRNLVDNRETFLQMFSEKNVSKYLNLEKKKTDQYPKEQDEIQRSMRLAKYYDNYQEVVYVPHHYEPGPAVVYQRQYQYADPDVEGQPHDYRAMKDLEHRIKHFLRYFRKEVLEIRARGYRNMKQILQALQLCRGKVQKAVMHIESKRKEDSYPEKVKKMKEKYKKSFQVYAKKEKKKSDEKRRIQDEERRVKDAIEREEKKKRLATRYWQKTPEQLKKQEEKKKKKEEKRKKGLPSDTSQEEPAASPEKKEAEQSSEQEEEIEEEMVQK